MMSNTRQLLRMNVFVCENHPIKPAIQNWSQILEYEQVKLLYFFATLSGYVMVNGKVAKMEKRISNNSFSGAYV